MLSDLVYILGKLGLPTGKPNMIDMNIRWLHQLSLYVDSGVGKKYFIKIAPVGDNNSLQNERKALQSVRGFLVDHVPEVLGYTTHNGLSFLILSSIRSDPLLDFVDIVNSETLREAWVKLFRDLCLGSGATEKAKIDKQLAFFESEIPVLARYVNSSSIGTILERLYHIDQHCDFVAANVGCKGDRPIVYDWEDYGRVGLPGFDVALFVGSLLNHDPGRLLQILHAEGPGNRTVRELVETSGIVFDDFCCLIPVYYGCFFWIKRTYGYGEKIQRIALNMITSIIDE